MSCNYMVGHSQGVRSDSSAEKDGCSVTFFTFHYMLMNHRLKRKIGIRCFSLCSQKLFLFQRSRHRSICRGESDALIRRWCGSVFSKAMHSTCALRDWYTRYTHLQNTQRGMRRDGEIWWMKHINNRRVAHRDCLFYDVQRCKRMVNTETCQTTSKCQV